MNVRTDGLLLLLRELDFRDPACSTSDLRGRHEVRISLEPAGETRFMKSAWSSLVNTVAS